MSRRVCRGFLSAFAISCSVRPPSSPAGEHGCSRIRDAASGPPLGGFRSGAAARAARARSARPAARIAEALGADRDERRARVEQLARMAAALDAAHADDRDRHARGDRRDLGQRDRAHRRARQAAGAAAEPGARRGRARPGASAIARSVLISDTASAPPSSAARAQAATSAVLGVSLTISGLAVGSAHARPRPPRSWRGSAPMSRPVLDVRARHVQLDRRDLRALLAGLDEPPSSAAVEPITFVISGTPRPPGERDGCSRSRELRQVLGEVALAGPCSAGRSS